MEEIIKIIQQLGFPIACCVALWIAQRGETQAHKEEMQAERDSREKSNSAMVEAINNNSTLLAQILTKLGE